jgi:hypothetical protein
MPNVNGMPGGTDITYDAAIPAKTFPELPAPPPPPFSTADLAAADPNETCGGGARKHAGYYITGAVGRTAYSASLKANNLPTLFDGGTSQYNALLFVAAPGSAYGLEAGLWSQTNDTQGKYRRYWAYTKPGGQSGQMYGAVIPPGQTIIIKCEKLSTATWRMLINGAEIVRAYLPEGANNKVNVGLENESYHPGPNTTCNRGSFTFSNIQNPNLNGRFPQRDIPYLLERSGDFAFTVRRAA